MYSAATDTIVILTSSCYNEAAICTPERLDLLPRVAQSAPNAACAK